MIYLRTQSEMIAAVQRRLRDTSAERWTATEITEAINRALETWQGRVSVAAMYELPDGWPNDAYEITLPDWMPPDVQPQAKWPVDPMLPNEVTLSTWKDVNSYAVEPAEDGTRTLRLTVVPYNGQVRLCYFVRNGALPTSAVTLSGAIAADATSLIVNASLGDIERVGWVRIGAEWIQYAGMSVGSATTTLENLTRGQFDTTAAAHDDAAAVVWGVAAPNQMLFLQCSDQACAFVHEYYLTDGSAQERSQHERMVGYYQNRADQHWRKHTPVRAPRWRYG